MNTFQANEGNQTSCDVCPSGATSSLGSSNCSCELGKFWYKPNCYWCSEYPAFCPTFCPAGTIFVGGLSNDGFCIPCLSGTYKTEVMSFCRNCPSGSTPGSDHCICESGKFWSIHSSSCEDCKVQSVSRTGALKCAPCPNGTIDGTACYCPAGWIWEWEGLYRGFCKPCPSGTFKTEAMTFCIDCPTHGSTSTPGSVHCICKSGFFWNGSFCEQCPEGSISQAGATNCLLCPSESDDEGASCTCSAGEAWSWENSTSGSCRPCPQGYYSNLTASCKLCPSGAFSLVGSDQCLCPAGKLWSIDNSSCVECGVQSVSQTGSLKCEPCPNGTIDGNACNCPAGWIWEWEGLYRGFCKPCPSGTHKTESISSCELCLEGYVSQAGSLQCQVCPPGSTDNLIRTVCTCVSDMEWNWSENGVGSCESAPQSGTPLPVILIPVIVAVVLAIICMYFVALLIIERRKNSWQRNTLTRVAFNRDTGVEIVQDQQNPLYVPWQRSTPEEDGVYNTLNLAQYHNERPKQTEDGEEGEEGEGVYNTLDH